MHRDSIDRYQVQTIPNLLGHKRLGSYLIEAGLITEAQINVALNDQQATGMRFGEILATRGWVKQQTIEYLMKKVVIPERKALERQQTQTGQRPSASPQAAASQRSQARPSAQATIPQGQRTVQQPREVPPKRSPTAARPAPGASDRRRAAVPNSTPGNGANASNDPSFQRREAPITKPLPPVSNPDDDVSWVG